MKSSPRLGRMALAALVMLAVLLVAGLAGADVSPGNSEVAPLRGTGPAMVPPVLFHVSAASAAVWAAGATFFSALCGALAPWVASASWPKVASLLHGLGVVSHVWRSLRGALGGELPMTLVHEGLKARGVVSSEGPALGGPVSAIFLLVGLAVGARELVGCVGWQAKLATFEASTCALAPEVLADVGLVGDIEQGVCRAFASGAALATCVSVGKGLDTGAVDAGKIRTAVCPAPKLAKVASPVVAPPVDWQAFWLGVGAKVKAAGR